MLKSSGTITVEPHKGRIVLDVSPDFVSYYSWHISRRYWVHVNTPLYDSHITIANPKFHKDVNWDKAVHWDKKVIEFEYDPYIIEGGYTKGFIMYYLKVYSDEIERMKEKLRIIENDRYRGLHITLGNIDKGGKKPRLYWPETITIR
jgi:hypothetical protein